MAALGAKHMFIRPHCPWQNGKVERFNRTLQVEWAYRQPFTSNDRAHRRPWPLALVSGHTPVISRKARPWRHTPSAARQLFDQLWFSWRLIRNGGRVASPSSYL